MNTPSDPTPPRHTRGGFPVLGILNPRRIPDCLTAFRQLDAPKVWIRNQTEHQIEQIFPALLDALERRSHTSLLLVSDDVIVTQTAYQAVAELLNRHEVVTGWCNLDQLSRCTTLTSAPPEHPRPTSRSYRWVNLDTVLATTDDPIRTFHPAMCLTGMSLNMWRRFPFACYGNPGVASDYHLARRLHHAAIPIFAPRAGRCVHTKHDWTQTENLGPRRLHRGTPEIVWDDR